MYNPAESRPEPPSSPLLSSLSEETKGFKHQKYRPFKPSTHSFDYPTPNPSSSVGYLPSDDVTPSSPVKDVSFQNEITPVTSIANVPEQKQIENFKKKVNFNLDLNKTSIISSNSVTSSPPRISKKRRVQIVSPLDSIKSIRIPLDSSVIGIGRSSKLNQYPIGSSNKGISRIHCQITYLEDQQLISLKCLGHNGINVTVPSAIDVHKLEGERGVYLVTSRSENSNELEQLMEDSDTENEIFGKPRAAASPRRILSRHQSFTNFCVFQGETIQTPLIEDTILDFKGELIRLRFTDQKMKKIVEDKETSKPVISATVPKSNESPLRANTNMIPSSPICATNISEDLVIPPSSPILGFGKEEMNSSPTLEGTPFSVRESSASPFVPFALSVATSKCNIKSDDLVTQPQQHEVKGSSDHSSTSSKLTANSTSLTSIKHVSSNKKHLHLSNPTVVSRQSSLNQPKSTSKLPSLNSIPILGSKLSSLNSTPTSASKQSSLKLSSSASKLPMDASKQLSLQERFITKAASSIESSPAPSSRSKSAEPAYLQSRASSAEPNFSEASVEAVRKAILSKMSDNQLNKRPRGRPPKSSYIKTEDNQHFPSEFNNADHSNQNHQVGLKVQKPKQKDEFSEIQELLDDKLQEITGKLDNLEEVKKVLINHLAYSRNQQTPLSDLIVLTAIQENKYNKYQVRCVLKTVKCIGVIERTGKDAAGKPLDEQYYYIPEDDEDKERARLVVDLKGSASHLRNCRKTHKQYYWKKPKK